MFVSFLIKDCKKVLHKTSKLQKKPSALEREHPALQKMKFINCFLFSGPFLPSWIRVRIANPDPNTDLGTPLNTDPIWIHSNWFVKKTKNLGFNRSGSASRMISAEKLPQDPNTANQGKGFRRTVHWTVHFLSTICFECIQCWTSAQAWLYSDWDKATYAGPSPV